MTVRVGDTVIVHAKHHEHNGTCDHPAIVTRVWSDDMINTMAFADCHGPIIISSVARKHSTYHNDDYHFTEHDPLGSYDDEPETAQ
jgi:hypothetical protein